MVNKNKTYTDSSIPYVQERDSGHFGKMFPGVSINNKYILWLSFSLYWEYIDYGITSQMLITCKDGAQIKLPKQVVRHMIPNKFYWSLCMKNGNKISDAGIILYFNSFEELNQIERIQCIWHTPLDGNTEKLYALIVDYHIDFLYEKGLFNYSINSKDMEIKALFEMQRLREARSTELGNLGDYKDKFDEYTNIVHMKITADENQDMINELVQIKGYLEKSKLYELDMDCLRFDCVRDCINLRRPYFLDYYIAKETIAPYACSTL